MLAASWPEWKIDDSMMPGLAFLEMNDTTGNDNNNQQQSLMTMNDDVNESEQKAVVDPQSVDYPSVKPLGSTNIIARYPSCNTDDVMAKYHEMMHGPIKAAFIKAASGKLYSADATANVKLPALEQELKAAMVGHVKEKLINRWTVCSSNVFGGQTNDFQNTPVMITLNCSPVDDGSKCCHAPGIPLWTPDYLQAIIEVLRENNAWPQEVVPLCIEYRSCCPLLIALSIPGAPASLDVVNEGGKGPSSMLGWHCGSYAEAHTEKKDRALFGSFSSVVHGAATASWLRILHAKSPAALGTKDFIAEDPAVARRQFHPTSEKESNIWISNMGLDGTPCDPMLYNPEDFHLGQHPTGKRLALYFDAIHPGRDIYLYGAGLERNLRTWCTVGSILVGDLATEIKEIDKGKEQGLSFEMASRVLEAAKTISSELSIEFLKSLISKVVAKLVAKGHGHVLKRGPHAAEVDKINAEIKQKQNSTR